MKAAKDVGYLLAARGHTCVNGAGSFGCMAAMNEGAAAGNGHIVGVIHEMWLVDSGDWGSASGKKGGPTLRDGGAHPVFDDQNPKLNPHQKGSHGGPHPALLRPTKKGPTREMLVAGGKDLQERKRLLVENADALIVLPGGPGTWDELWEMACARQLGLTKLPIVVVNVDKYYEPFRLMLERAWEEKLAKLPADEILHFEDTAEGAVKWIEAIQGVEGPAAALLKRTAALRSESMLHTPVLGRYDSNSWVSNSLRRSLSCAGDYVQGNKGVLSAWAVSSALFGAGMATGVVLAGQRGQR